jgi:hypothetical protein
MSFLAPLVERFTAVTHYTRDAERNETGIRDRASGSRGLLGPWPVERPPEWDMIVEALWAEADLAQMRPCLERGRPLGSDQWVRQTAAALGLTHTLRPRGRPPRRPAPATTDGRGGEGEQGTSACGSEGGPALAGRG